MTIFKHPDMKTIPAKAPELPKMITRKIKFQPCNCADEGGLIVKADQSAHLWGGYVIKCKILNRKWGRL